MKSYQLSSLIAFRYLKAKKSVQAINTISYISIFAVTVLAAAMIVLLSVFNGFELLLKDLYKAFYPDIKITALKGKWMTEDQQKITQIQQIKGVQELSKVAEDMVLIFKDNTQKVATLKGVDEKWFAVTRFDSFIVEGMSNFNQIASDYHPAIVGVGIAGEFGIDIRSPLANMDIYYPREDAPAIQIEQSLNNISLDPKGIFSAQEEFDSRYILVPLHTAQLLFDNNDLLSSIEIKIKDNADASEIIAKIEKIMGKDFLVQSQYEQNKTIYMVMKSEKLAIYIILSFVLLIASFTLVGVLSMIAIDKKQDMSLLKSLGASNSLVYKIFMFKGLFLSLLGAAVGILLGILICVLQQQFGIIKLAQGFIIEDYPVDLRWTDSLLVIFIVFVVGSLAAYFPALKARMSPISFREE